jgi:hypothetical protein
MAKVHKLVIEYDYDFELLGIGCSEKSYCLAWHINNTLGIELWREIELKYWHNKKGEYYITNYKYEEEYGSIFLLKNKAVFNSEGGLLFLLPELKKIDYFVLLYGKFIEKIEELKESLKKIEIIDYVKHIEIATLKSKQNLIIN